MYAYMYERRRVLACGDGARDGENNEKSLSSYFASAAVRYCYLTMRALAITSSIHETLYTAKKKEARWQLQSNREG